MTGRTVARSFRERDPTNWPILIDMLPPMAMQSTLDPRQELFSLDAIIIEHSGAIATDTRVTSDLGIRVTASQSAPNKACVSWGSTDPFDEERATQREVFTEIQDQLALEDVVIQKRGCVHPVPGAFSDQPSLQTADEMYFMQKGYANRARSLRRNLRLQLDNPYHIIKGELMSRGYVNVGNDPLLRRIRSVIGTEWILPDNNTGYEPLLPIARPLQLHVAGTKFWQDTAVPHLIAGDINSDRMEAVLYRLSRRSGKVIGL